MTSSCDISGKSDCHLIFPRVSWINRLLHGLCPLSQLGVQGFDVMIHEEQGAEIKEETQDPGSDAYA